MDTDSNREAAKQQRLAMKRFYAAMHHFTLGRYITLVKQRCMLKAPSYRATPCIEVQNVWGEKVYRQADNDHSI